MTDVSLPVAGTHEYDVPRAVHPRPPVAPWSQPRSLLLWDGLMAALAGLLVSTTLVPVPAPASVPVLVVLVPLAWCLALSVTRAGDVVPVTTLTHAVRRLGRAGAVLALAGCAASAFPGSGLTSREAFVVALTCTAASLGGRAAIRVAAGARGVRGRPRVLVVGDEGLRAAAALERRAGPELSVVSVRIDDGRDPAEAPGVTTVAADDLASYATRVGACSVLVMPEAGMGPEGLRRLQWLLEAERVPLYVGTGLVGVSSTRLETTDVGGLPLVRVLDAGRTGARSVVMDVLGRCVAALALVVSLPLLALLCVAIRRESPGPAVFRQRRVGQDGRLFTIYKLRTMGVTPVSGDALVNESDGVLFKMRSDPRVTPLGRRLRRYSLDELPQLLNVVLGQMRLVGPRPALPHEVTAYSEDARRRLAVRPGVTGLWQVSGRSDLSWEETVRLDLHYVDNWSPTLDLVILCRTVGAVLGHRGAY